MGGIPTEEGTVVESWVQAGMDFPVLRLRVGLEWDFSESDTSLGSWITTSSPAPLNTEEKPEKLRAAGAIQTGTGDRLEIITPLLFCEFFFLFSVKVE